MVGEAHEGSQFDARQYDTKRNFRCSIMDGKEIKDPMKNMGGKDMGNEAKGTANVVENGEPTVKKRARKKFRPIPEYYFLPRRSVLHNIARHGSFIVVGIGAGMLAEVWMKKKAKEDGDVIWEFGK